VSGRFILGIFLNVIITMILIVVVKRVAKQWNIPFLSSVAEEV